MADKIRVVARGYTVLQNSMIVDKRLTLKTKGLFAVILSRPSTWDFSVAGLAAFCGCGRDAVRGALKELEEAGYLTRQQLHGEGGAFAGNLYTIQESSSPPALSDGEDPPLSENPTTVDAPLPDFPSAEKPSAGNPTERNKDLKKEGLKEPPIVPQGGQGGGEKPKRGSRRRREPREAPDWKPERFAGLWAFYPKRGRQNKQDAMNAWDDLKPDDALIDTMARALVKLMATDLWKRGHGIPYVGTFLRQRRWENAQELDGPDGEADGTVERRNLPVWT